MSGGPSVRKPWSLAEDTELLKLVEEHGPSGCWPKITLAMDSRTGKQCRERYINHLDPDMKKSAWTAEENNVIRDNFAEFGTKWSQYMVSLPGRSDNAIKNRYHVISRNNFDSCNTVPATNSLIKVIVSQKRPRSETSCAAADTFEESSTEGDSSEDQNRKRLKKLLAARIVLELEILELEKQCSQDEEEASLSTHPTSPPPSDVSSEMMDDLAGELDSDFDFDFEWTEADTLLATEHAQILEVKCRKEAVKVPGKKVPSVLVIRL
eukprot:gene11570-13445_t